MPIFRWLEQQEWIILIADNWLILGIFLVQTRKLFPCAEGDYSAHWQKSSSALLLSMEKSIFFNESFICICFYFISWNQKKKKKSPNPHETGICCLCSYRVLLCYSSSTERGMVPFGCTSMGSWDAGGGGRWGSVHPPTQMMRPTLHTHPGSFSMGVYCMWIMQGRALF